jgi:catalase
MSAARFGTPCFISITNAFQSGLFTLAVVLSDKACKLLVNDAAAVQFVMDAFGNLKAIGANQASQPLLEKAGVNKARCGRNGVGKKFVDAATRRYWDREPTLRQLA